jgi:asparagine synthase (glutamine-hydrolysing)
MSSSHQESGKEVSCLPTISVYGYCEFDQEKLQNLARDKHYEQLRGLGGEYTLVIEQGDGCTIITSEVGAMHYFYTCEGKGRDRFVHGRRVADLLHQAGLDWQWNWQALGDLCQLENLTGNATLHPDVHRVPPGSVLTFSNGQLHIDSRVAIDGYARQPHDPTLAVDAFNASVAQWAGSNPYLSLSGGFDSRVILSACLHNGIQPHLVTVGSDDSSDVRVAQAIARRFGLKHDRVQVKLEDFLQHGLEISSVTNGTKPACHWHTYLYPLNAQIPRGSTFFVGTLGEFARSYYFDHGQLGRLGDRFPAQALPRYWNFKLHRHPTFLEHELPGLAPLLSAQLNEVGIRRRAERLSTYCHGSFLPGLARYYFEQRVPNFYANGIAMYQASSQWRSPFHNRTWLQTIWNLKPSWKLGSNWHRFAIQRNCPALLEFPEENGFDPRRMLTKAPPLYWTSLMRRTPYITYDLSSDWYRQSQLQDSLVSGLDSIAEIIDPAAAMAILQEHRAGGDRTRSLAFLLTMVRWKQVLAGLRP